jgi:drug/metabolite transporter (DMT)-like permease
MVGGSFAVALYFAICQFCVAHKGRRGLWANWPTVVTMTASLMGPLVFIDFFFWRNNPRLILGQGLPMLISGCFGIFVGAVLAARVKRQADANTAQG